MAIVSRPNSPEFEKKYDEVYGVVVETDCQTCHRRLKIRVSKEAFDSKQLGEYTCKFCGCTHAL
jgi:hypothetical protein